MQRFVLALSVAAGFMMDRRFGDPDISWHPIRLIGRLISALEKILYPEAKDKDETDEEPGGERKASLMIRGSLLVVIVCAISIVIPLAFLALAARISLILYFMLAGIMCYFLIASKSLEDESNKVRDALMDADLGGARKAVSRIVGRDTERLDEAGVIKAVVETVAENTSDGVVAPMFYILIGGPAFGCLYKAVNTMDSMIGYKSDRYIYFGRTAAILDDIFNFIPSRITAGLMILSCGFAGLDRENAVRIWNRDRKKTSSPNAGQTESAAAGALDIMLGGDAWYFGKKYEKNTIGDDKRPPSISDIMRSLHLMRIVSYLFAAAAFAADMVIGFIMFKI